MFRQFVCRVMKERGSCHDLQKNRLKIKEQGSLLGQPEKHPDHLAHVHILQRNVQPQNSPNYFSLEKKVRILQTWPTARQMEIYEFIRDRIYSEVLVQRYVKSERHSRYARQMVLSVPQGTREKKAYHERPQHVSGNRTGHRIAS